MPFPPPEGNRFVDCTPTYLGSLNASKRIHSTYAALTGADRPKFVVVMRPALDRAISHWSHAARMSKVWIARGKVGTLGSLGPQPPRSNPTTVTISIGLIVTAGCGSYAFMIRVPGTGSLRAC